MTVTRFDPSGLLHGRYRPPADKSISHRAALFGAMGERPVHVTNYLDSADTRSTLDAVAALGASIENVGAGDLRITGIGMRGAVRASGTSIDVGNSGTLLRLLPGWLAGQEGGEWTLDGDESIRRRPVDRVAVPLGQMGADLRARDDRLPPLEVKGSALHGMDYEIPVASAQVKSCVLIAGLLAQGTTTVREGTQSRDHTERILRGAGVPLTRDGGGVRVAAVERLEIEQIAVPGDPSSAAFMVAAAALVPGSAVTIEGVGLNWTRTGFMRIARRMGASIAGSLEPPGSLTDDEPIGELEIAHAPLVATEVGPDEVPLAIDELTLVALLGAFAEGDTVVWGAEELRHKESDRIAGVVAAMRAIGAEIEEADDGFRVRGTGGVVGGRVDALGDHRLAMLGAIAGLASRDGVEVDGMEAAAISYPGFEADLAALVAPTAPI